MSKSNVQYPTLPASTTLRLATGRMTIISPRADMVRAEQAEKSKAAYEAKAAARKAAQAKANAEVEARQAELDEVLKASCKVLGRMDIHWKARTRVWQLAYRGGQDYREAVLLAKSMCLGANDRAKALEVLGLR